MSPQKQQLHSISRHHKTRFADCHHRPPRRRHCTSPLKSAPTPRALPRRRVVLLPSNERRRESQPKQEDQKRGIPIDKKTKKTNPCQKKRNRKSKVRKIQMVEVLRSGFYGKCLVMPPKGHPQAASRRHQQLGKATSYCQSTKPLPSATCQLAIDYHRPLPLYTTAIVVELVASLLAFFSHRLNTSHPVAR